MAKKKILLFGGTFNPIHNGHLIVVRHIAEVMGMNKIVLVPNGNPPHKSEVVDKEHRYEMLKRAVFWGLNDDSLFDICRYEIEKDTPSYALETVRYFKRTLKDTIDKPYWVIGPDNITELLYWHKADELAEECNFIAGISTQTDPRCYPSSDETEEAMNKFNIQTVIIPHLEIRSTEIRERVAKGLPIRHFVPDLVEEYIREHGLYRTDR